MEMDDEKTFYVIFKCGYEGIEKVTSPTTDPREALTNIINARKRINDAKSKREEVLSKAASQSGIVDIDPDEIDEFEDVWDTMLSKEEITFEEWEDGKWGNPDQWCLQQWNGEEFECCCDKFGVKTSKPWLF